MRNHIFGFRILPRTYTYHPEFENVYRPPMERPCTTSYRETGVVRRPSHWNAWYFPTLHHQEKAPASSFVLTGDSRSNNLCFAVRACWMSSNNAGILCSRSLCNLNSAICTITLKGRLYPISFFQNSYQLSPMSNFTNNFEHWDHFEQRNNNNKTK